MSDEQAPVEHQPQDPARELARALRKCTPKQRKWLREFASDPSEYATGKRLGYSAHTIYRWLRVEHVRVALTLLKRMLNNNVVEELRSATARTVQRVDQLATPLDVGLIHDKDSKRRALQDWPEEFRSNVSEITYNADGSVKTVKFVNERMPALATMMKFQRLIVDRTELTGPDGQPLAAPVINIVERDDTA